MDKRAPDTRPHTAPPFDGLRAYLQAVQSGDDLRQIRLLEQRNGRLKRSVERIAVARNAASGAPQRACWKRVLHAEALDAN